MIQVKILLYQYFDKDKIDQKNIRERLQFFGFSDDALKISKVDKLDRNYAYPQFELHAIKQESQDKGLKILSDSLLESFSDNKEVSSQTCIVKEGFTTVEEAYIIRLRDDQKAEHLNFTHCLIILIKLTFECITRLRLFLEKDNYNILKKSFINKKVLCQPEGISSMPTVVFISNEFRASDRLERIMDIATPFYNISRNSFNKISYVERGYPFVNYIIHDKLEHFITYSYEHIDLALMMYLHGYLDRDLKTVLTQSRRKINDFINKIGKNSGNRYQATNGVKDISLIFEDFKSESGKVNEVTEKMPEIDLMLRIITQKYRSPDEKYKTIFQIIAEDNDQLSEGNINSVVATIRNAEELFKIALQNQNTDIGQRVQRLLLILSSLGIVTILDKVIPREKVEPALHIWFVSNQREWAANNISLIVSLFTLFAAVGILLLLHIGFFGKDFRSTPLRIILISWLLLLTLLAALLVYLVC